MTLQTDAENVAITCLQVHDCKMPCRDIILNMQSCTYSIFVLSKLAWDKPNSYLILAAWADLADANLPSLSEWVRSLHQFCKDHKDLFKASSHSKLSICMPCNSWVQMCVENYLFMVLITFRIFYIYSLLFLSSIESLGNRVWYLIF